MGLVYLLVSIAWIGISGHLLIEFVDNRSDLNLWLQVRGYLWVACSALVIYLMSARVAHAHQQQHRDVEQQKRRERGISGRRIRKSAMLWAL